MAYPWTEQLVKGIRRIDRINSNEQTSATMALADGIGAGRKNIIIYLIIIIANIVGLLMSHQRARLIIICKIPHRQIQKTIIIL